jgi:hypothetical protein
MYLQSISSSSSINISKTLRTDKLQAILFTIVEIFYSSHLNWQDMLIIDFRYKTIVGDRTPSQLIQWKMFKL